MVKSGDTSFRDAVFGNVGTKVVFRIGADDAEFLERDFAPAVTQFDLVNVPKYNGYAKLLIENENPPAFNFQPFQPEKGNPEIAKAVKELSRLKYGRDRRIVEAEIEERQKKVEEEIDSFF